MRIGSLFTGYGGLDIAAEQHFDATTAWTCDIDPGASKIIAHHWPDIPNLHDITAVDWDTVEPVEILAGGWPCQPFSLAGKQKGAADERALWPEVARAVRALRPRHIVLENVAAITTAGELGRALADLAALRYVGQWRCLRAADIGAPHGRARIFILATNTKSKQMGAARLPRPHTRRAAADTASNGRHERWPEPAGQLRGSDATQRSTGLIADTTGDTRRLSNRNNGTTPNTDDNQPNQQQSPNTATDIRSTTRRTELRAGGCDRVAWGVYEPAIRRWEHTLGRLAPPPTETSPKGTQRLSPAFVEWMMGLPAGWVTDTPELTRNAQLKALGNGVVPQQALAALELMA